MSHLLATLALISAAITPLAALLVNRWFDAREAGR
jgi:hypothetical protein